MEEKETARNKYPWQPLRFDYKTFLTDKYNIGSLKWEERFFAAGVRIENHISVRGFLMESPHFYCGFVENFLWIQFHKMLD